MDNLNDIEGKYLVMLKVYVHVAVFPVRELHHEVRDEMFTIKILCHNIPRGKGKRYRTSDLDLIQVQIVRHVVIFLPAGGWSWNRFPERYSCLLHPPPKRS